MLALAILWFIGAGILTVLMSSPSIRYIETSSVLVAPLLIYWAVLLAIRNDLLGGHRADTR